jgi:3-oxoadipate enol-lactonase
MKTHVLTSSDDVKIALHDFLGTGEPLLFLHGTGFPSLSYIPLIKNFTKFFSCYSLDLRGHGRSEDSPTGYAWQGFLDDVTTAIQFINRPVYIFAHSLGGALALRVSLDFKEQIRAIYCYEPIVFTDIISDSDLNNYQLQLMKKIQLKKESFISRDEIYNRYAARGAFARLDSECLKEYINHAFLEDREGFHLRTKPASEGLMYCLGRCPDLLSRLGQIQVRTRLSAGLLDIEGPAKYIPEIQKLIPNSTSKDFALLSHLGPLENPLSVADDVLRFLLNNHI